jgi:hypothetical protein
VKSKWEILREDTEAHLTWWHDEGGCQAVHGAYNTEALLLKSDFGRLQPQRAHETAFAHIPERFRRFSGPLGDLEDWADMAPPFSAAVRMDEVVRDRYRRRGFVRELFGGVNRFEGGAPLGGSTLLLIVH